MANERYGDLSPVIRFRQPALYLFVGLRAVGTQYTSLRRFPFGLRVFKAARLNTDRGLLAAAVPAVVRKPELAFDT